MHNANGQMRRQSGKMVVPLLSVLAALAMGVGGVAMVLQMQEREKRQAAERQLHLTQAENEDLRAKLEDLQAAKASVEADLEHVRQDLAKSQGELAKAVEAQETLARSVEDREREIGRLKGDMEQVRNEAQQAATQLGELQQEREQMKRQLADLEQAKTDLEGKVMELSEHPTVELDRVLVTNEPAPTGGVALPVSGVAAGPNDGQVVVINREYDFIVMNLGKNHGLSVGQEFQVVRGTEVLGRVKVEKIYDELSAAAILPDSKKDVIREGDTVKAL